MPVTYFKRYRMEIELAGSLFSLPSLPTGYRMHTWHPGLLSHHADVKYRSFCGQIDAQIFPCLGEMEGCHRLMEEISRKRGFLPEATWLLSWRGDRDEAREYCGTIQGIRDRGGYGAIQNLGIVPEHRGQGLAASLLARALEGFQQAGLRRCYLEVTADNGTAIGLYERFGFFRMRTVYKAVQRPRHATVGSA